MDKRDQLDKKLWELGASIWWYSDKAFTVGFNNLEITKIDIEILTMEVYEDCLIKVISKPRNVFWGNVFDVHIS